MAKKSKSTETAKAKSAKTGASQKHDRTSSMARAEVSSFLTEEELEARQAQIGLTRRFGGPSLDSGVDSSVAAEKSKKSKKSKKGKKKKSGKKSAANDASSGSVGPTDIPDPES